jgi:hypothetical protein
MLYMMAGGGNPGTRRNTARLPCLSTSPMMTTSTMPLLGPFIAAHLRHLPRWIGCWSINGMLWSNLGIRFCTWVISPFDKQQSVWRIASLPKSRSGFPCRHIKYRGQAHLNCDRQSVRGPFVGKMANTHSSMGTGSVQDAPVAEHVLVLVTPFWAGDPPCHHQDRHRQQSSQQFLNCTDPGLSNCLTASHRAMRISRRAGGFDVNTA